MLQILPVVSAWATGVTPIVAFDEALSRAGVGDVNLVTLSSIVPPGHRPEVVSANELPALVDLGFGDLAFSVVAEQRTVSGPSFAGLGWAYDRTGRGGIFLEGHGVDHETVTTELELGLEAMAARRPSLDLEGPELLVVGGEDPTPSCAVVVALVAAWSVLDPRPVIDLSDSPTRPLPGRGTPPSPASNPR